MQSLFYACIFLLNHASLMAASLVVYLRISFVSDSWLVIKMLCIVKLILLYLRSRYRRARNFCSI